MTVTDRQHFTLAEEVDRLRILQRQLGGGTDELQGEIAALETRVTALEAHQAKSRRTTDSVYRAISLVAWTEISSALRHTFTPAPGGFVTLKLLLQWEHNTAGGYLAVQFWDLALGQVPSSLASFVLRNPTANANVSAVLECMIAASALPAGLRTLSPVFSTGSGTAALRGDAVPTQFVVTETTAA